MNRLEPHAHHDVQREFFARLAGPGQILELLNVLTSGFFFIKDEHSRMVWATRTTRHRLGFEDDAGLVGRGDYEIFPKHIADGFVRDDRRVMQTKTPLQRRAEMWFTADHRLQWFVTTKFPLLDQSGAAIGILGYIENSSDGRVLTDDSPLGRAISFIENHHTASISVEAVAAAACLSTRQLLRVFHQSLGMSVQDFATRVRIEGASAALLEDDAAISNVAIDFGFCDQSAFTKAFRSQTGMTPAAFQRKYRRL